MKLRIILPLLMILYVVGYFLLLNTTIDNIDYTNFSGILTEEIILLFHKYLPFITGFIVIAIILRILFVSFIRAFLWSFYSDYEKLYSKQFLKSTVIAEFAYIIQLFVSIIYLLTNSPIQIEYYLTHSSYLTLSLNSLIQYAGPENWIKNTLNIINLYEILNCFLLFVAYKRIFNISYRESINMIWITCIPLFFIQIILLNSIIILNS